MEFRNHAGPRSAGGDGSCVGEYDDAQDRLGRRQRCSLRVGRSRPRPPIFPTDRALPTPSTSRSTPIAGPAPISAAISAMPGARSTTIRPSPSGFAGGVQAGYNWQSGPWVFGIEGDLQASGADDTFAPWKFSNPWFGTVRGRVGYAFNNVLFYGTGGLAFGELTRRDVRPVGIPYQRGLDRGRRRRIRLRPELERQARISLCRSVGFPLQHHRHVERLPVRIAARRRQLSLLIATRKYPVATSRPLAAGIFLRPAFRTRSPD